MTTRRFTALFLALMAAPLLAQETSDEPSGEAAASPAAPVAEEAPAHPRVVIRSSLGDLTLELWPEAAPKTVANFIALAQGTKEWTDGKTGEQVTRPFYDGLTFHRVIKGFMVQGGCPNGDGSGNPGYRFEDEINGRALGLDAVKVVVNGRPNPEALPTLAIRSQEEWQQMVLGPIVRKLGITNPEQFEARRGELEESLKALTVLDALENIGYRYDESLVAKMPLEGVIAMANAGPNTNGSQFFINLADTPWLAGKHTVFGKVVEGGDVLAKLAEVAVDPQSARPIEPVTILSIRLVQDEAQAGSEGDGEPAAPGSPAPPEGS